MRARDAVSIPSAALAAIAFVGCAQILSYDDYSPRTADATTADVAGDTNDAAQDVADSGPLPARPPVRPAGAAMPSGKGKTLWLIVDHFYLNQQDLSGSPSKTAWRTIGYDIDHVCTGEKESRENTGTCRRVMGASQDELIDGDNCRDNNFGSQLVPFVSGFDPLYEQTSNDAVHKGVNTWILKLEDVDDGTDDAFVSAKLYKAAPWKDYGSTTPAWDGSDVREIAAESVDGDLDHPHTVFPSGWLANNVWVSGDPQKFAVNLPIQGLDVTMPVTGGLMTLELDPPHAHGKFGTIAGAIAQTELKSVVDPIADQAGLCPGAPLYSSLYNSLNQMFDVVVEQPTLQDVNVTCDGLSFGFGFTVVGVQPPTQILTYPPVPKKCAGDGG